jgi:hypothetical protein
MGDGSSTPKCEICQKTTDANKDMQFDLITNNVKKRAFLCNKHAEYFSIWFDAEKREREEEKSKVWIYVMAGLLAMFLISYAIPKELTLPTGTGINDNGFRFLLLTLIYMVAFSTPNIYNFILHSRFLNLKKISLTHKGKNEISPSNIIQIDVTAIFGVLILMTILSLDSSRTDQSTAGFNEVGCQEYRDDPEKNPEFPKTLPPFGRGLVILTCMDPNVLTVHVTGTIVMIFAFSAIAVMIIRYIEVGIRLLVGGFVYLFLAMLVLTYL